MLNNQKLKLAIDKDEFEPLSTATFVFYIILIIVHLMFLILVFYKKKEIKNTLTNLSYCRISDHILTITGLNMTLYAIYISLILISKQGLSKYCQKDRSSPGCKKA